MKVIEFTTARHICQLLTNLLHDWNRRRLGSKRWLRHVRAFLKLCQHPFLSMVKVTEYLNRTLT